MVSTAGNIVSLIQDSRCACSAGDKAASLALSMALSKLYRLKAEPGEPRRSEPHQAGAMEHLLLMRGRARAGPVEEPVELHVGDYMSYPADQPHLFEALENETAAVIVVEYV